MNVHDQFMKVYQDWIDGVLQNAVYCYNKLEKLLLLLKYPTSAHYVILESLYRASRVK